MLHYREAIIINYVTTNPGVWVEVLYANGVDFVGSTPYCLCVLVVQSHSALCRWNIKSHYRPGLLSCLQLTNSLTMIRQSPIINFFVNMVIIIFNAFIFINSSMSVFSLLQNNYHWISTNHASVSSKQRSISGIWDALLI